MRYLMNLILIIVGVYGLICLLAFVFQSQMIFFPDRRLMTTPDQGGMTYEDVFFDTEDSVRLHGWFVPAESARATLLFFHGNAGNISHRIESIRIFHDLGLSVFIFDYRSYGRSGGRISEKGVYADGRAALKVLGEKYGTPPEEVIYFGRSLGGGAAIELATHATPKALIIESGFPSVPELGQRVYPWLPVRWLGRIRFDSKPRVARLDCPKLFIHSRDDEIAPFAMGQRLFDTAAEPKSFLETRGDHNSGFLGSGAIYVDGLAGFLASLD